jgi:hypothetical protein
MSTRKEFSALITMYSALQDTEEILNSEYHDQIMYDIDGYRSEYEEHGSPENRQKLTDTLKKQVEAMTKLVIAMKNVNFIYG